jgi:mRNA interferase MazF
MVNPGPYVPRRGDLIWITLTPQAGRKQSHEQAGRRPAAILSPHAYNAKVGLTLLCPITSRVKDYPFEVAIPAGLPVAGVILSDQIKSMDWRARKAEWICSLPPETVSEVLGKLGTLLKIV